MCSSAQRGGDAAALAGSETGTAHGRGGPYRVECRFSLRFCGFLIYVKTGCRAPMCAQGGLRTWERDNQTWRYGRSLGIPTKTGIRSIGSPLSHVRTGFALASEGPGESVWAVAEWPPDGIRGPVGHDRADRARCLLRVPRSGLAVGSPRQLPSGSPGNWDVESAPQQDVDQSCKGPDQRRNGFQCGPPDLGLLRARHPLARLLPLLTGATLPVLRRHAQSHPLSVHSPAELMLC